MLNVSNELGRIRKDPILVLKVFSKYLLSGIEDTKTNLERDANHLHVATVLTHSLSWVSSLPPHVGIKALNIFQVEHCCHEYPNI